MDVVESKWYEMDMSLNDVKNLLSANIKTMSRSFIAAEYYMKYIRDRELCGRPVWNQKVSSKPLDGNE